MTEQSSNTLNDSAISEVDVADFLRQHPQFFAQHIDLLAHMHLPSQHGEGTVSLAERQQGAQREKIRALEAKITDFLKYGQENDRISEQVHRLSLGLLASPQLDILVQILIGTLCEDFQVPYAGLRVWAAPKDASLADNPIFTPVPDALVQWTASLVEPYCGTKSDLDAASWFGEEAKPQSYALIALRGERVIGLLAIASDEPYRFHADMGNMFLKRIGELVSASLLRYV